MPGSRDTHGVVATSQKISVPAVLMASDATCSRRELRRERLTPLPHCSHPSRPVTTQSEREGSPCSLGREPAEYGWRVTLRPAAAIAWMPSAPELTTRSWRPMAPSATHGSTMSLAAARVASEPTARAWPSSSASTSHPASSRASWAWRPPPRQDRATTGAGTASSHHRQIPASLPPTTEPAGSSYQAPGRRAGHPPRHRPG